MIRVTYDWPRLRTYIRERMDELGINQVHLAGLAGVAPQTIRNLLGTGGRREFKQIPDSLAAVERVLGWIPGSGEAILLDGEPTLLSEPSPGAEVAQPADARERPRYTVSLPERVAHRLENGDVFAADVFRVGELDIIVVAKAGSTPDDIRRAFESQDEAWRSTREAIEAAANARKAIEQVAQSNGRQTNGASGQSTEQ